MPLRFSFLMFSIGSFDSSVHISEEASNADTAVPWAIVYAIGIAGVLGWGEDHRAAKQTVIDRTIYSDQCFACDLYGQRSGKFGE